VVAEWTSRSIPDTTAIKTAEVGNCRLRIRWNGKCEGLGAILGLLLSSFWKPRSGYPEIQSPCAPDFSSCTVIMDFGLGARDFARSRWLGPGMAAPETETTTSEGARSSGVADLTVAVRA
jgi:hypothetical protein